MSISSLMQSQSSIIIKNRKFRSKYALLLTVSDCSSKNRDIVAVVIITNFFRRFNIPSRPRWPSTVCLCPCPQWTGPIPCGEWPIEESSCAWHSTAPRWRTGAPCSPRPPRWRPGIRRPTSIRIRLRIRTNLLKEWRSWRPRTPSSSWRQTWGCWSRSCRRWRMIYRGGRSLRGARIRVGSPPEKT